MFLGDIHEQVSSLENPIEVGHPSEAREQEIQTGAAAESSITTGKCLSTCKELLMI